MIKLCVVTGNRAEYGLLKPVMDRVGQNPDFIAAGHCNGKTSGYQIRTGLPGL
ncbi:MAG: hypothetical protein LBQ71_09200 [Hungatella sp.]|nr:hypothetical protein [Hungatella sp.]